jgi:hypothetical protein
VKALLALTLLASPAFAADGLTGNLTVALPSPDAIGDGLTPVTVHVLTLAQDGTPIEGLEVTLKSKTAKEVGGWTYDGGGIYSFTVLPPRIEHNELIWVSIKGKTPDKLHKIDMVAKVPIRSTPPMSMTVVANPAKLVSGDSDEATLSFTLADGRNVRPEMLRIRTTLGEVGELSAMGGGRYVTKFNVAKVRDPGLALITVSDLRRPELVFGSLSIPVSVKRDVAVRAPTRSSVLLKVGGREFGPIEARSGTARIPAVLLPPGVTEGTAVTVKDGETSESPVDLGIKIPRRLLIVPPFEGIPADPQLNVPIRVLVMTPDGKADAKARPVVETTAGKVVSVVNDGFGMHVITLEPTLNAAAKDHTLTVTLPDETGQTDSVTLKMTPVRPSSITVTSDPDPLGQARAATLTARLVGPGDVPLDGRVIDWNLTGAKPAGPSKAGPDGTVVQPIQTFGGPIEVRATAKVAGTGNGVHQVVIIPGRSWLPGDTISSTMLTVMTLDSLGYPVGNVPVQLQLEKGDGSLPREATTDGDGVGQVFYTAGKDTEIVRIRAVAGEGSAVVALMQGPNVLRDVSLPVSGSAAQRALAEAWGRTVVTRRVEAE